VLDRESLLLELIGKARLGIVVIDQEHRVIEANRRFCEMLGYTSKEITSLYTWDWAKDMSEEQIRESFRDLSQIDVTFESRHCRKDGSMYDAEVSATGTNLGNRNVVICICQDISAKKQTERELAKSEKKFRNYVENAADIIFTLSPQGIVKYISPNCKRIWGYEQADIEGTHAVKLLHPSESVPFKAWMNRTFVNSSKSFSEYRFKHKDGRFHWYGLNFSKLTENDELILICNARNIDETKEYEEKLRYLSLYDQLTGISNRTFFYEELCRQEKLSSYPLSVLVCDLDGFKAINDNYGHPIGDKMIIVCSHLIRSALRKEDFLARLGGDEFAVLLKNTSEQDTAKVIEKIKEKFDIYNMSHQDIKLSISIGQATTQDAAYPLSDLVIKADKHMYIEKNTKKCSKHNLFKSQNC